MSISIVMATYNGEKYIDAQILSIVNQKLLAGEIIVCDDRSTDNTPDILEKYCQQGLLKYEINHDQLGVIRNFKKAVSLAQPGNWVALSDQDDEWLPDKLERSVALLSEINDDGMPCIVYADLTLIDNNSEILNQSFRNIFGHDSYRHNLQSLLYSNFVTGCTVLMNAKAREWYAKMPDDIRSHDEWLALIAFTFGKAASINVSTVKYRKHSSNVSMPEEIKAKNRFKNAATQVLKAIKGEDDFLTDQFKVINKFYQYYSKDIPGEKRVLFKNFLKLQGRSYLRKKLAYRRMVNQNSKKEE